MGVQSIKIFLNNKTVFYAGGTLSGFCQIDCTDQIQIQCFEVRLKGYARVHWSEKRMNADKNDHFAYSDFTSSVDLICLAQELAVPGGILQRGICSLPFRFQLPSSLVTSFEGSYGYIRYWLEAQVPQNWFKAMFAAKGSINVKILQPVDTNASQYAFPVGAEDSKSTGGCCSSSGQAMIRAKIDRAAYCPNENVCITGDFENRSSQQVKPYVKLVQRVTFFAKGHTKQTTSSWPWAPADPTDSSLNPILENGSNQWKCVKFPIPSVSPSISMPLIHLDYYIEIGLDIPMAFDLSVYLPVIIGTIPFKGQPTVVTQQITQPASGTASTFLPTAPTPWQGTGRNSSGGPPASAPSLDYGLLQSARITELPPSYFESVFSGQQVAISADDHIANREGQSNNNEIAPAPVGNENKQ